MSKTYWVYILECSDGSFYTGSTSDINKRLSQHQQGKIRGYTSNRRPVKLVFSQNFENVYDAISAERQIKGWRREKKKALIKRDFKLLVKLSNEKKLEYIESEKNG